MARIEALTTPQKAELCPQPSIKIHIEPTTPECQRYWDEVTQGVGAQYHPEDDTYIVPATFPMEFLTAFNGQIVDTQKFVK